MEFLFLIILSIAMILSVPKFNEKLPIGLQNIITLNSHNVLDIPIIFYYCCKRFIKCKDIEQLFSPSSF